MDSVKIWDEQIALPTYETGEAGKNPMFLEGRVLEGYAAVLPIIPPPL